MCSPKPMSTGARRPRGPRAAHGGGQRGRAGRRHTPGGAVSCCIWLAIAHSVRSGAWVTWVNQPRRAVRTLDSLATRQGSRSKLDCAGDCRGGVPCMCLASCPRAGVRPRSHCHCKHVSYVRNGLVGGEGEYLFTACSVLTVRRCEWSDDPTVPSRIVLSGCCQCSRQQRRGCQWGLGTATRPVVLIHNLNSTPPHGQLTESTH